MSSAVRLGYWNSVFLKFIKENLNSTKMPFMIGRAPVRRTLKYLEACKIIFRDSVKIFSINYNVHGAHHQGAR